MSYKQEGNSCGAWDLTRLQMIKRGKASTISENTFRAFALNNYRTCTFKQGDSTAGVYNDWVTDGYTDPWRLATELGGSTQVHIAQTARGSAPPPLLAFVDVIENLKSRAKRPLGKDELTSLTNNKHAILSCMMDSNPALLHYVLLTRSLTGQVSVYDSNSETLNDTALATMPAFGVSFTSQLSAGGRIQRAPYTLTFTGLWIKET